MRLQLHVELLLPNTGLPPVWRRILVPAHWVFEELSDVIQVCMGWEFEHPWVFSDAAENATEHIAEDDEDYGFEGKSMLAYEVQLSEKFKNKGDQYFWTYNFAWKKKYGGLLPDEMRRLKQLEDENARLKRIVAASRMTSTIC